MYCCGCLGEPVCRQLRPSNLTRFSTHLAITADPRIASAATSMPCGGSRDLSPACTLRQLSRSHRRSRACWQRKAAPLLVLHHATNPSAQLAETPRKKGEAGSCGLLLGSARHSPCPPSRRPQKSLRPTSTSKTSSWLWRVWIEMGLSCFWGDSRRNLIRFVGFPPLHPRLWTDVRGRKSAETGRGSGSHACIPQRREPRRDARAWTTADTICWIHPIS